MTSWQLSTAAYKILLCTCGDPTLLVYHRCELLSPIWKATQDGSDKIIALQENSVNGNIIFDASAQDDRLSRDLGVMSGQN